MSTFPGHGTILGIDYGRHKVGLAVSSPDRTFVFGRGVVRSKSLDHLIDHLRALASEEGVCGIVMGLPLTEAGTSTEDTDRIMQIATRIEEELQIPVVLEDERYTSKLARQLGGRREDDEGAARLILESAIRRLHLSEKQHP